MWVGRHNLDFTVFRSRRGSVGCTASLLRRGPKGSHGSNNFANEQHFLPLCVAGSPVGCVRVAQSFLSSNGFGVRMPITDGGKLVPVADFRLGFAVGFDPKVLSDVLRSGRQACQAVGCGVHPGVVARLGDRSLGMFHNISAVAEEARGAGEQFDRSSACAVFRCLGGLWQAAPEGPDMVTAGLLRSSI